ncbi:nucleoside hydrolase [Halalkalibacter okhensis]|uniref:nucleoside hydrolase n=1 Tax=Halalkalibacter okhensis TaxID=333138 RepID=UPI001F390086|nr:nucleoside hydrolase [Halalkalibacter okhensis]
MSIAKPVLIDADTGIDDSLAIVHALMAKDLKVEGITTVFGNTTVEQATENTLRIIQYVNPGYDVPVVSGAAKPLLRLWDGPVHQVHGLNGIGNVELPKTHQKPIEEMAAEFIVRKANEFEGELSLITLGRLTNIAEAIAIDPLLPTKFKEVIVMGGALFAPGNIAPRSEANFYGDPEAVQIVIQSGMPITMVGLDVTMKARLTREQVNNTLNTCHHDTKHVIDYIQHTLEHYFAFYEEAEQFKDECPLHDPLTILVARDPSLVTRECKKVRINCDDPVSPGSVELDLVTGTEISICLDVERERAVTTLLSVFHKKRRFI